MPYTEEDWQRIVWRMVNLSASARERLPTERWRYALNNDEENARDVAFELNGNILKDLEDIGIFLTEDPLTIFTDDGVLTKWINLVEYIAPSTLYLELRDDKTYKDCFYNLLSGSLEGDLITSYLQWLKLVKPSLSDEVDTFVDVLKSNDTFPNFVEGQLTLIEEEKLTHDKVEPHYLRLIEHFVDRLKQAQAIVAANLSEESKVSFESTVKEAIREVYNLCADPSFSSRFGWWLSVKQKELPFTQKPFYLKVAREIHAQIPLSKIYKKVRGIVSDDSSAIDQELVFLFACGKYLLRTPITGNTTADDNRRVIVEKLKEVA